MRLLLSTAAMAVAFAGPAFADDKKPVVDPAKRICRTVVLTGSIMPGRRACHTRAEWALIDGKNSESARDATDRINRQGSLSRPGE